MSEDTGGGPYSEWEPTVHLRWSIMGELEQRYERDIYFDDGVYETKETEMEWRPIERQTIR